MSIPKIFHHIWVGPNKIPEKSIGFIAKIKELHPEYTFMLWTDKDLTIENFSNLEYIHKAKRYAQKSDIMRLEILYKYGGIYLDTDFELFKNITPLLTHDIVICNEDEHHSIYLTNAFIACSKGNVSMKRCVDNVPNCKLNGEGGGINFETGPWYIGKHIDRTDNFRLLPIHVMYPVHYSQRHDPIPEFSDETYGMHHWDHSWA